jgi:hypothetical protein
MKENDEIRMTRLWQPPARQANAELMTKSEWVAHACSRPRSASPLDLFSANSAYQLSLGQRPREVEPSQVQALKVRFIQRDTSVRLNRAFSAWFWFTFEFLGRCPRLS